MPPHGLRWMLFLKAKTGSGQPLFPAECGGDQPLVLPFCIAGKQGCLTQRQQHVAFTSTGASDSSSVPNVTNCFQALAFQSLKLREPAGLCILATSH